MAFQPSRGGGSFGTSVRRVATSLRPSTGPSVVARRGIGHFGPATSTPSPSPSNGGSGGSDPFSSFFAARGPTFGQGSPRSFFNLPKSNLFARLTNALTNPTAAPPSSPSLLSPPSPSPLPPPNNVIPFPGGDTGGGGGGGGGFYSQSEIEPEADEGGPGGYDHSDDDDEVAASHDQGDGGPSDGYGGDHATNLGPHDNEEDIEEPSRADVDAGVDPEEAADIGPEPTYKAGDFGPGDPGGPPPGSFMPTHYEVPEAFKQGADDGHEEGDDTMTGQDYLNALDDDGMSGIGDFFKTLGENTAKAAAQTALTAADKALGGKPKPLPTAPPMSTGKKIAIAVMVGIPLLYLGTRMMRSKPAAPAVATNPRRRRRRRRR